MDYAFNANILKEEGKAELAELLESLRGRKCLVLDVQLGDLLNQTLIEGTKILRENGVAQMKELRGDLDFGSDLSRDVPDSIIYFVRPNLHAMKTIARQVRNCIATGIRSQYHIYFVPHRTVACEQVLEDEGVLDHIEIGEFNLGFVPYDTDLISLEMESVFRQCYVDLDTSSLNAAARALLKFQSLYGVIPNIKVKGLTSRKVIQKFFHLRREEENAQSHAPFDRPAGRKQIDVMVMLDREVDLVSPLVSPLTYEGLIDEVIGIENGRIKVEPAVLGDDKDIPAALNQGKAAGAGAAPATESKKALAPGEKATVLLNSAADSVFAEIRDLSIERLGAFLQEKAIRVKESYSSFRENKDASIVELHDFVKKIPQLTKDYKSLNMHINIAELVKRTTDSREFRELWQAERAMLEGESILDQVEDMICEDADRTQLLKVFRLICIQSVTAGGIRTNKLDTLRRLIAQTYGYEHLFTLCNLEKAGLIKKKDMMLVETTSVWQNVKKALRLIDDRINMSKPDDISYVSAGYAPLSVRLVQALGGPVTSWGAIADAMRLLPGPMIEFTQSETLSEELPEAIARSNAETLPTGIALTSVVSAAAAALGVGGSSSASLMGSSVGLFAGDGEKDSTKPVMLVFVVGGLSYLEVAAFRFLSKDPAFPYSIVMATTKMVNGKSFLHSMEHECVEPR